MSHHLGRGFSRGELAVLMFEDRVCPDDLTCSIVLSLTRGSARTAMGESSFRNKAPEHQVEFLFDGDDNPLGVLAGIFPTPTATIEGLPDLEIRTNDGAVFSLIEMIPAWRLAELAVNLVIAMVRTAR